MALNTFDAGVIQDQAGNVVAGYRIDVYTAATGGSPVTALYDMTGILLPGYVLSSSEVGPNRGRVRFQASDAFSLLWADDGNPASDRWPVPAVETYTQLGGVYSTSAQAVTTATDAQTTATSAATKADATQAQQTALMTTVATIDVPSKGVVINRASSITATTTIGVGASMLAEKIASCTLAFDLASVAASDTNYWTISLIAARAGVDDSTPMVTKTTKATAGQAIVPLAPWKFSGAVFNTTLQLMAEGDVLRVKFVPTGAPAAITSPFTVSWRGVPL